MQNPKYKINQIISGWKIKRVEKLPENGIVFVELAHIKTGARYVHLESADQNNVFCAAFKTVPEDSSGVAHILEHTVLTGSKKYPVHDPFFSMIRRSMKTFMNAFTSSDWTAYPFATQNRKDYFNLMSVYLDAVFNPLLLESSFEQEGWRLDSDSTGLKYKGIVYNEMKGSMSSIDRIMSEAQKKALFLESPYRFNSGGEPKDIIKLTHADLAAFHRKHYHPSNAFFFSYGNFSLAKTLAFLKTEVMDKYDKAVIKAEIKPEKRFRQEVRRREAIPLSPGDDAGAKHQFAMCWLQADLTDTKTSLALEILEDVLIGNEAAPLRRALIESGLGSDLADGSGYNMEFRDTLFSIGLKDARRGSGPKIKKLIMDTLTELAEKGIDDELFTAALQKLAIAKKEVSNEPYPFGLKLWLDAIGPWIHGGDVLKVLKIDADLELIKEEARSKRLFPKLISKYFLDNRHRVFLELVPEAGLFERQAAREAEKLKAIGKKLGVPGLEKLKEKAMSSSQPAIKPEDLSCLPILNVADISVLAAKPFKSATQDRITAFSLPLNGLCYANLYFDLAGLKEELLPLMPFFCYVLNKIGTKKRDYISLVKRIDSYSGGVEFLPLCVPGAIGTPNLLKICLSARFLEENSAVCLDIMEELAKDYAFLELERLSFYLKEQQLEMEMGLVESPQSFALSLAASSLSENSHINELWSGKSQLQWLKENSQDTSDGKIAALREKLGQIAAFAFTQEGAKGVVIANRTEVKKIQTRLIKLLGGLDMDGGRRQAIRKRPKVKIQKGLAISTQVSSSVFVRETAKIDSPDAPALFALSKFLQGEYLHKEIREKGGAYGAYCRYDYLSGFLSFLSYRDPFIKPTLETYLRSREFVQAFSFTEENIQQVILQACSEIDRPLSPRVEAERHFLWREIGLAADWRERFKQEILAVKASDLKRVARKYLSADIKDYSVVVVSSEDRLNGVSGIEIERL